MSLADILGGLGGLGEGYLRGTNQLQQLQSQQYANALRQLQLQQLVQGGGAAWGALQQGVNPMNQPGSPVSMMDQTQAGLPAVQQSPLSQPSTDLPQVPQATSQMGDQLLKGSWFGNSPGWRDPSDSGLQAGGQPVSAGPGIALPNRGTLGQMFDVTAPSGQTLRLPQTDIGPAKWTGRGVDINSPAAQAFGYTPQNFPTDQRFEVKLAAANQINQQIDQSIPPPVKAAAQGPATTVLRSLGANPMSQIGQHDPSTIVNAIDKANPGAPDFVKFAAFQQLYPLLTNAGKLDFAQAVQLMHVQQSEERIENQRDMMDLRLEMGSQPKGAPFQPLDAEGKPSGPPVVLQGNKAVPIEGLPESSGGGLSRVGAKPVGGGVSDLQAQWVADYIEKVGTWPATTGRNQLLQNKVEQILAERKVDPTTIAVAKGAFKADEGSLTKATTLRDAVHSYEGTALRNLDQATIEMEKTAPTNFGPFLNHWIMTGETQMGDTKPPAAVGAVITFANEYAKVMSGSTGAQAATDSSRREAAEKFSPYFSKGQFDEAARIARTDMKNRMVELDNNIDIIKGRMGRGGQSSSGESSGVSTSRAAPLGAPDFPKMSTEEISKWLRDNP